MYCRALDDLRCALRNENMLSIFEYYPEAAPWCHMACKSDGTQLEESSYERCDITYVDDECVCRDADSNDELLEKLPRTLDIMQKVFTSHFWNSIGNRSKLNVYYTWLAVGQSVPGRQLRQRCHDRLSYETTEHDDATFSI